MDSPAGPAQTPAHARSVPLYVGAGLLSVGGHYAATIALVELLGVWPLAASAIGFAVGALVKYVLNYFVAFRSAERHAVAIARFAIALGLLFALNALVFAALHQFAGLHYILAQVLTTGLLVPPGYLLSRGWVFAASAGARARPC